VSEPENPDGLKCPTCEGSGIQSTYNGVVHHPMYGKIDVVNETKYPDCPGGQFYGGSGHHQCRSCKGSGLALPENTADQETT
jgi:DnaJ-class molecular chaperone